MNAPAQFIEVVYQNPENSKYYLSENFDSPETALRFLIDYGVSVDRAYSVMGAVLRDSVRSRDVARTVVADGKNNGYTCIVIAPDC